MEDWEKDGSLKIQIGQVTSDEVIDELLNCLPPKTYNKGLFQVGEPVDSDLESVENGYGHDVQLYCTFKRESDGWVYCGNCRAGETINRKGFFRYCIEQEEKSRLGENK